MQPSNSRSILKMARVTTALLAVMGAVHAAPAAASAFVYRVPIPGVTSQSEQIMTELLVSLTGGPALPGADVGWPYNVDLNALLSVTGDKTYNSANVEWAITSGELPNGLSLGANGVISGAPTMVQNSSFQVLATYKTKTGQQAYTITVNGVTLHVTQISAGHLHTCAMTTTGGAKCWGADHYGQLGNDTAYSNQMRPVDVAGLTSGVLSIDARGLGHSCAVTTGGAVKCWGDNSFGQLGSGTGPSSQPLPVNVQGLTSGVAQVIVGRSHTCAITTSGGMKCWGYDAEGQLGNDSSFSAQPVPVDVVDLGAPVVSASASSHTCAVLSTGGVKCWGLNAGGRLGDGTVSNQPTPVAVQGLTFGVTGVSTGPSHTCVVTSAGAVKCWGTDSFGELGNDADLVSSAYPVTVYGAASGFKSVSAGDAFTCAVTTAGGLKCWGRADMGKLGNGMDAGAQPVPSDVVGLTAGVVQVSTGTWHTCAITATSGSKCWGRAGFGQLGNSTVSADQATPIEVQP